MYRGLLALLLGLCTACGAEPTDDAGSGGSAGSSGSGGAAGAASGGAGAGGAGAASAGGAAGVGGGGPRRCNGHAELCDRPFNQVAFAATHNSMSNADDSWLAPNQVHGIERQLADGVRSLLIDTYDDQGTPMLCHSSCSFGKRPLLDAFTAIAGFLAANPNEVLSFIIEDYLPVATSVAVFEASGLDAYVYTHQPGSSWPTLGAMIDSGQRLLVTAQDGQPPPAWYHNVWDLSWDTPYTFKAASEFSCDENRGSRDNDLFLLNHWIETPLANEQRSAEANQYDVLLGRAQQCQTESGKFPNFIAVNHYSVGDVFRVVDELNGVTDDGS